MIGSLMAASQAGAQAGVDGHEAKSTEPKKEKESVEHG
jgi:hypothetical protein